MLGLAEYFDAGFKYPIFFYIYIRFGTTNQYLIYKVSVITNFLFTLQFTYQRFIIVSQLVPQFKWEMWPIYNSISSCTEKKWALYVCVRWRNANLNNSATSTG